MEPVAHRTENSENSPRPPARRATVLIVDDDPDMLETVSIMLELAGYEVLSASSGAAALKLCGNRQGPVHLLLTDIDMPLMSGPELASHLSRLVPEVAIVFMTAHPIASGCMLRSDAFGGHRIIRKPFTAAELREHMRSILRTRVS